LQVSTDQTSLLTTASKH